jgi:hypothetical protein
MHSLNLGGVVHLRTLYGMQFSALSASDNPSAQHSVYFFAATALIAVAAALGAHILYELDYLQSEKFSLFLEGGYGELIQYGLALIAAVAFLVTAFLRKTAAYGLLAAIMFYLFIDDAFQIHENAGAFLAVTFSIPSFLILSPAHGGEALYLSSIGLGFIGLLAIAARYANPKTRADIAIFTGLLVLAGLFGVVIDGVHGRTGSGIWGLAEDGGELVIVALLSIYAVDRAVLSSLTRRNILNLDA